MKIILPLLVLIFTTLVSHLAIVVFWPSSQLDSPYSRISDLLEPHRFYQISDDFGGDVLQFESQDLRYAICHYDLSDEALVLSANINDGFGMLSVYSEFGEVLFSINSSQTKMVQLKFALLLNGADNNLPSGMVFHRVAQPKGMVIIRLAVGDKAYYKNLEQQLASAKCDAMKFQKEVE